MKAKFSLLFLITILALIFFPFIGGEDLINGSWDSSKEFIFYNLRLPRVFTGFLVGGGLALAGLIFQALFRNQLASPYTLGISSGSAFMASLWIKLGITIDFVIFSGLSLAGFLGAMLSVFVVFGLAKVLRRFDPSTLILAGLGQGMFFSSAILLFQFIGDVFEVNRIVRWTMGGVEVVGFTSLYKILPVFILVTFLAVRNARALNVLMLGEDIALSRGINVEKLRKYLFAFLSLLVGVIIAEAGPIGFIGLIAPHSMRQIFKNDYRVLIPTSILFGGFLLISCDLIGRGLSSQMEIPVGIVTAFLGGPFFLYILLRGKHE